MVTVVVVMVVVMVVVLCGARGDLRSLVFSL